MFTEACIDHVKNAECVNFIFTLQSISIAMIKDPSYQKYATFYEMILFIYEDFVKTIHV